LAMDWWLSDRGYGMWSAVPCNDMVRFDTSMKDEHTRLRTVWIDHPMNAEHAFTHWSDFGNGFIKRLARLC